MNAAVDVRSQYREDFRRIEPALPGTAVPWLRELRQQALTSFMDTGFPTVRDENWKYTDVRAIAAHRFTPVAVAPSIEAAALGPFASSGYTLVFVDGCYAPALSSADKLPHGVRVASLAQVLSDEPQTLEPWLGRYMSSSQHGFAALNAAFLRDGAFVRIGRDTVVEEPINLLFVASGTADVAIYLRNLIVAEVGSRATVVEHYVALGAGTYLTNAVTEVVTEPAAALEHYRIEREVETAYHLGATHVYQTRDSRYASHSVTLGGRLVRHELTCTLDAEGAECALNGLYVGHGRQHMDHHTRIEHRCPRGTSREWYKGVLDDHARGIFSGRVVVHPQAQRTDAEQANHNLLLSDSAEADSRPQFEIYADDVKCSHGSTVGSLDPDALFYLRTRALDETLARQLLVYAFASDILARMRLAPLRMALERDFAARLLQGQPIQKLVT